MIELEREGTRDPTARRRRGSSSSPRRSAYQDQQAEGIITLEELRSKLAVLEEARKTAQRELEALRHGQERLAQLEHDKETLLEYYESIIPEASTPLPPSSATTSTK
jgi:DNA repair exonuclease SbcCD ATPase subunit